MKFKGCLVGQIKEFREFVNQYYSRLEEIREIAEEKLSEIPIFRIESGEKWYLKALNGKRVVGVDGSQLTLKEAGIPAGVVQISKLAVVHGEGKSKVSYCSAFVPMEENVDLKRFQMEIDALVEEADGKSWLFFDGSLISSFSLELSDQLRKGYICSMALLLKKSKETQTPLIGYVDRSYAKDLAKELRLEQIYDSFLLSERMDLLCYTPPFKWRGVEEISYAYIKINPSLPIRIEYPSWMEDMHEEIVRVIVAECMLGGTRGYPYILERAHSYSAIGKFSFMHAVGSRGISFKWMSKVR
jgi:hypothetical protein